MVVWGMVFGVWVMRAEWVLGARCWVLGRWEGYDGSDGSDEWVAGGLGG